ncbi:hypothetical protein SDC9_96809 [bioreactor metagenome]|uniref:Uncharacterized protein n=1 Tax=bioreactor metagenome TaxID=1076179 RepID=A0A645AA36_9ZZZZ
MPLPTQPDRTSSFNFGTRNKQSATPISNATIGSPAKSKVAFKVPFPNGKLGKLAKDLQAINRIGTTIGAKEANTPGNLSK